MSEEEKYATIRETLGGLIGRSLLDVTQQDEDEFREDGRSYVMLHFDNGSTVKFFVEDHGFEADIQEV